MLTVLGGLFASSASAYGPVNLDAGLQHTCFVTPAGTVKCWGDNEHGQLGDETTTERHAPVEVTGLTGAIEVAAGGGFSCALTGAGKVWCWGDNEHGQLGDGTETDSHVPVEVTGLPPAAEVEAGGEHACAITETLGLWCWGDNEHGQLGDGTETDSPTPVEVSGLPETYAVALGEAHTCARFEGKAWCWGANEHGQLGDGTETDRLSPVEVIGLPAAASELRAGDEHTCADSENRVWCWGDNEHGQLGDGTETDSPTPVEVTGLPFGDKALAAGGSYTCAFSYFTWCWGDDEHGQLGDGMTTDRHTAAKVTGFPAGPVAAGGSHACALNATGKVRCWGDDEHGQLGDGLTTPSSVPVGVKTLSGAIVVATSGSASCAVTGEGRVKCWGKQNGAHASIPTEIAGLEGVTGIDVSGDHSCALAGETGKAWCWGGNGNGQLGDGTTNPAGQPVEVSSLSPATAIAVGELHSCALVEGGTVECWGNNEHGQLGDETTTERHAPVAVKGLTGAIEVTAGGGFSCALTGAGKVWCWGDNEHSQLGDGTETDSHVPVEVTGLPPAVEIAAGGDHACAISEALAVWCWGDNEHGQLGDETTTERHAPVEVTGISEASQITAGADYTCVVLTAKGEPFWCWGDNEHGQLGDKTTIERHAPAEVLYLAASSMLAAGGAHTCALLHSGLVECWGDNEDGQVGDGTEKDTHSPVQALLEKEGQRIGVQVFNDRLLGDPPFRIGATATSNLFVGYTSPTPGVCKIDSGEIHLIGLGECEVEAGQAGNDRYAPAVPVDRRFQVGLAPGTGAISGRVSEEAGEHDPLPEILVCALRSEEEEEVPGQNCELTDGDGEYVIANLPLGDYKVEFWPRYRGFGYVAQYYDDALHWGQAESVEVTEGLTGGIDAALAAGAEISGTVTDAFYGEPLGNVLVCAEDVPEEFEECEFTDQDGSYRIMGLSPGEYRVSFLPPEGEGFRPQFYKGRSDSSDANLVRIALGGVRGGIDAALEAEATITGVVTDAASNTAVDGVEVCAFELTGFEFEACELTEPTGAYVLTDLPAGQYKVGFFPPSRTLPVQYWNDQPDFESADILTLGLGTTGGIDAALGQPPTLPGPSQPVVTPPPPPAERPRCPAGKRRKTINGKSRCVKRKHRHRRHHRHRRRRHHR